MTAMEVGGCAESPRSMHRHADVAGPVPVAVMDQAAWAEAVASQPRGLARSASPAAPWRPSGEAEGRRGGQGCDEACGAEGEEGEDERPILPAKDGDHAEEVRERMASSYRDVLALLVAQPLQRCPCRLAPYWQLSAGAHGPARALVGARFWRLAPQGRPHGSRMRADRAPRSAVALHRRWGGGSWFRPRVRSSPLLPHSTQKDGVDESPAPRMEERRTG